MTLQLDDAGVRLAPDATASQRSLWNVWQRTLDQPQDPIPWPTVLSALDDTLDPDGRALVESLHARLGLPELGRARIHLDNLAPLGRPGFRLRATLREGARPITLPNPDQPVYTDTLGRPRLLDAPSWTLFREARATPPSADGPDNGQYLWWGQMRRRAEEAAATLSPYLARQEIGLLDRPAPVLEADGDAIVVRLESQDVSTADTDAIFENWGPRAARSSIHTLPTETGRKRIVVTESGTRALREVSQKRTFRGAAAARLAENPESVLSPELFDLSAYSDRVIAIGPPRYRASVVITSDDEQRDWRSGLSEQLVLSLQDQRDPEAPPIQLDMTEPEDRDSARDAIRTALEVNEPFAEIQGHQVRVDPQLAATLGDVRSTKPLTTEPPIERPDELQGKVLQIKENVDELEHGQKVGIQALPEDHQPSLPRGLARDVTLRTYQHVGVAKMSWWTDDRSDPIVGGLLADDMGLGKTLQVLVVLALLAERNALRPSLVVAPVALLENWRREAKRFVPGSVRNVAFLKDIPKGHEHLALEQDLVLTSYESLVRRDLEMGRIDWRVVICDEAQKIKNPSTRAAHTVKAMKCTHRIAMTGTPVENSLDELWSIADFFQPGLLGSLRDFRSTYSSKAVLEDDTLREQAAQRLTTLLDPLVVRRMKQDVAKDLPPIHRHVEEVPFGELQRTLYQVIHRDMASGDVLGTIQRLMQVSAHPALASEEATDLDCPKLTRTLAILDEVRDRGEKVLLFVKYLDLQALLKRVIDERYGLDVHLLSGQVNARKRQPIVDAFSAHAGFDVLILSPRSCGVGLNITAANHVVHYTREWNPAVEAQATDRAFRIGQTRPVHVWIPIVTDPDFTTVEVTLARLLEGKEALRSDFVRPSAGMSISLAAFQADLASPGDAVLPMQTVSDRQLAEQVATQLGAQTPEVMTYPWGIAAESSGRWWCVVRDPGALLANPPGFPPTETTLLLRQAVSRLAFRMRSRLGRLGTLVEEHALSRHLSQSGVEQARLLRTVPEVSPPAPVRNEPVSIDTEAVLAREGVNLENTNDSQRKLLAALLELPKPIDRDVLAHHLGRGPARIVPAVSRLTRVLHASRTPLRIDVSQSEDGSATLHLQRLR